MKLFVLDSGIIRNPDKSSLTPGRDVGTPVEIPTSMYLIDHPQGLVVVDTGIAVNHWADYMQNDHDDDPGQHIDAQIKRLGYDPDAVKYVILSHLHGDHAGGMTLLPKATFIIRREELRMAWWPPDRENGAGFYMYEDYRGARFFNYIELDDDEEYDVFGDGRITCIDTRGHTRGHQSVILNLPETGKVVLALDAASMRENIEDGLYPGTTSWDIDMGLKSLKKLQRLKAEGALVLLGHDPEQWQIIKKPPEFYR